MKFDEIRDSMNRQPALVLGGIGLVLFLVLAIVYARSRNAGPRPIRVVPTYFTDDDGASVFTDGADKLPPFDHNGREAVRAYCVTGSDGKPKVSYLEKWTENGKAILQSGTTTTIPQKERLLKRPGDPAWLASNDPKARALTGFTPP